MALSKEEKDALNDHFKGKDLYDPSKDPEQEVTAFTPKGMACGGMAEGYAEGGEIDLGDQIPFAPSDFEGPQISSDDNLPTRPAMEMPPLPAPVAPPAAPLGASKAAPEGPVFRNGTGVRPMPAPKAGGMVPDEYSQLVKYLGEKPTFGQGAMSALAGLADSIESGVARAGNTGFQKNILESQQDQKKNLIEVLRGKYESGLAGKRLTEEGRHNREGEKETRAARVLTQQQQDLALRNAKVQQGFEADKLKEEKAKNEMEQAQKGSGMINAIERKLGFGPPLPGGAETAGGPVSIKTHSDYLRLPAGTHYVDSSGKEGVKK